MPKTSESKKLELEAVNSKLVTKAREPRKLENYLDYVRSENAKNPRKIQSVASLPVLTPAKKPRMMHRSSEEMSSVRQSLPTNSNRAIPTISAS